MDLQTAVAASMLPTSRARVAAAFKELAHESVSGLPFLEFLWSACVFDRTLGTRTAEDVIAAASRALDEAPRMSVSPVVLFDPRYPALLAATPDPPPVIWLKGSQPHLTRPAVAVVGSRAATPYALQVGTRLASELAQRSIVVVSGLARGVDSAAHQGCLEAGGATVAVQGCGLDRVYPVEHEDLATRIARYGLLVSELAPGAPPLPEHFPLRNRIISGISLATVVVEASERSGSLITARYALEQGREVMAVPGSVLSGRNRGSHALLKDGARVVETADDVLEGLGWAALPATDDSDKPLPDDTLLATMAVGEAYGLEELAALTSTAGIDLLPRLTQLEIAGLISSSGGRFVRIS
jgi:DNA processing protein